MWPSNGIACGVFLFEDQGHRHSNDVVGLVSRELVESQATQPGVDS
jgi:hypothetical protein